MPINPFQQYQEAGFGGVNLRAQQRGSSQMGAGSLSGQGHRSQANMQAPTVGELKPTPKASGQMPQGNADIGRANYGQQRTEQPQQQGRRATFGGMGAGAVRGGGGGGMTAGGDIKFDLSIGKTDQRGADMRGARIGAVGMGASSSDSNFGDIDQSQTYSPTMTGPRGGSSRGGTASSRASAGSSPASGPKKSGAKAPAGQGKKPTSTPRASSPKTPASGGSSRSTATSTANTGRGGDASGNMRADMGAKFGSPTLQVGRNKIARDTFSDQRNSRNTTTNNDNRKPASDKTKTSGTAQPAKEEPKNPSKTPAKTPAKEAPKAEATSKEKAKDAAKTSVKKAVEKGPADAGKTATVAKKAKKAAKPAKSAKATKDDEE